MCNIRKIQKERKISCKIINIIDSNILSLLKYCTISNSFTLFRIYQLVNIQISHYILFIIFNEKRKINIFNRKCFCTFDLFDNLKDMKI